MNKIRGFTLIELMIATTIIGILSTLAYPAYINHVLKGRRIIAQGELLAFANAMEQYYIQNSSDYREGGVNDAAPNIYPTTITIDGIAMYNLTVPSVLASSYTLKATPVANTPQASNGYLQLTNTGARKWADPSEDAPVNHW